MLLKEFKVFEFTELKLKVRILKYYSSYCIYWTCRRLFFLTILKTVKIILKFKHKHRNSRSHPLPFLTPSHSLMFIKIFPHRMALRSYFVFSTFFVLDYFIFHVSCHKPCNFLANVLAHFKENFFMSEN